MAVRQIFYSDWATVLGTAYDAVTDHGKWPLYDEFNHGDGTQLLSVIPDGPNGAHALRVVQRGAGYAANLQQINLLPASRDFTVSFWMRNADTSPEGDHVVTPDIRHYGGLTYVRRYAGPASWQFAVSLLGRDGGPETPYPLKHWRISGHLLRGNWYRFDYTVTFTDQTHIQVRPRVSNLAGALLFDATTFQQQDYGASGSLSFKGKADWTLASYYAAGLSFEVSPEWLRTFALGNNGQQNAIDTGLSWDFAQVSIAVDLSGPVQTPPATLPPGTYQLPAGTTIVVP